MSTIQLNPTATHFLEVNEVDFNIIKKYALFQNLADSTGYVTEEVLERLRMNVRALLDAAEVMPDDLYRFFAEILLHDKMKAFGLEQLMKAYAQWEQAAESTDLLA